jgi:2-oxoisovalerate dehydrogenase E1 component alpha subunit
MPSHWGLRRANVVSHSSPVATQTAHASGVALGIKLRGDQAVVLTSIGEGSTSQGEWYEGVNWAATQKLPAIFLVENNIYAISVRLEQQMAVAQVADKAKGLGLPGISVDGMDVMAMHQAVSEAVERARAGEGPTLVEARVYRLTPHSSDDDDRSYRSRQEVESWRERDPLLGFQQALRKQKVLTSQAEQELDAKAKEQVEEAVAFAEAAPYPEISEASYPVFAEDIRHG